MSGAAEGTAKRGFYLITPREGPLYDPVLMCELRQSHPLHGAILENSIKARRDEVITGAYVGMAMGGLSSWILRNHFVRTLPAGFSSAQVLVRTLPTFVVCFSAGSALGAHVGDNWGKGKNPHEAEAKFYEWLQNRELPQLNLD